MCSPVTTKCKLMVWVIYLTRSVVIIHQKSPVELSLPTANSLIIPMFAVVLPWQTSTSSQQTIRSLPSLLWWSLLPLRAAGLHHNLYIYKTFTQGGGWSVGQQFRILNSPTYFFYWVFLTTHFKDLLFVLWNRHPWYQTHLSLVSVQLII